MKGSIQQRGDRWRVVIDKGVDATGKRRQIVRTADTAAAAEDLRRTLLAEHGAGITHDSDATVEQLLTDWMRLKKRTLGVRTVVDYRSAIAVHIPANLKAMKVWKVRTHDIDRLYIDLGEAGLGAERIQRVDTILRGAFGQAVRWQWIARNPALDATRPSVRRGKPTAPTVAEVQRLIAAADEELLMWVRLAAHLGARRGEVAALQWADFDLESGSVRISRALADGGPGVKIVAKETKSDRERTIAVGRAILTHLARYRTWQRERALAAGTPLQSTSHLFAYDAAGMVPWRPDRATKRFTMLRDELGLHHVQLKNLRHFMATQMLAAGVDVKTVSGRAGHARTSTTLDFYGAFIPANDRTAADELGDRLG